MVYNDANISRRGIFMLHGGMIVVIVAVIVVDDGCDCVAA